jgi:hypothetical protein
MSSSYAREPLSGLIRQGREIVGSICLPDEDPQEFIDHFNHCYGPLSLRIEANLALPKPPTPVLPVGAAYRSPLRPPTS